MDLHEIHFDRLKSSDGQKFKLKKQDGGWPMLNVSAVHILKAIHQGTEQVQCGCQWGAYWCHLANTIVCVCVAARWPYVNFDHLL